MFGVKERIPEYLIREEMQREMLRSRAGRRWGFEERLNMGKGSKLARICKKEIRERAVETYRNGRGRGDSSLKIKE